MPRTALPVLTTTLLVFALSTGCPRTAQNGEHPDTDGTTRPDACDSATPDGDTKDVADTTEVDGLDTADASDGEEADGDDGGQACEAPPTCDDDERLVDCVCVDRMNRRCVDDGDCRPDETCEDRGQVRLCIYEPPPVETCPGSEGCEQPGDQLRAGAASRVVTPEGFETPTPEGVDDDNYLTFGPGDSLEGRWNDCGIDGLCPGDPGYDEPDRGEGDGEMQGMWLAGFGTGRPAQYCPDDRIGCDAPDCCVSKRAHDHLKVQVAAVERGDTTVVFATVDTIGWFHTDLERVRRRIAESADVDLVVMAGTHNHEAPDTAGQWGPGDPLPERTGRSDRFVERIVRQTDSAIDDALDALRPVEARATVVDAGTEGLAVDDSRPPYVFNDDIPVLRLVEADSDATVATLLSFSNHAEVLWNDNPYITADYPHYVRKYVREGLEAVERNGETVAPAREGFGGVTLMFAGSVGGLINPGEGGARTHGGEEPENDHGFAAADALGQQVASRILRAADEGAFDRLQNPPLAFARKEYLTPIENRAFQLAAFQFEVLERAVYNVVPVGPTNFEPGPPQLLTEVAVVRIGSVTMFTAPGEVFSETLTGGYPGRATVRDPVVGGVGPTADQCDAEGLPTDDGDQPCIVAPDQTNPPDWANAPEAPFVYGQIPGEHPFFIGLGQDFLGYMVPPFDFETDGYLSPAEGSHYEETQSVGPRSLPDWRTSLETTLDALPER